MIILRGSNLFHPASGALDCRDPSCPAHDPESPHGHRFASVAAWSSYVAQRRRYGAPDPRPGRYYVSARRDDGATVLVGEPFATHREAIDAVDATRAACRDPRACWYVWGTARKDLES